jgi:hypothetical protein
MILSHASRALAPSTARSFKNRVLHCGKLTIFRQSSSYQRGGRKSAADSRGS